MDDTARPPHRVAQEHGHAIRHKHGQGQAGHVGEEAVRFRMERGHRRIGKRHADAMNLAGGHEETVIQAARLDHAFPARSVLRRPPCACRNRRRISPT